MSGTSDIDGNDQLRSSFLPVEAADPSIARPEANLRQHRTIRQEPVARDFSSAESLENRGILGVFPVFQTARMGERPVIRPQTHLRGVALLYHGNPANSATRNCPSEKSGKLPLSARKSTVRFLFDGSKSAARKKSGDFQKLSLTFPKDWV